MGNRTEIQLSEPLVKRLQRRAMDLRFVLIGLATGWYFFGQERPSFDELRTFCCFIGHGRSGSTLVGALLNAHPNVVMSNELNALRRLRTGLNARQTFNVIYLISRRQVQRGSVGGGGYSYSVPGQWQGKHKALTIIGDRKAGATSYEIFNDPALLDTLDRKVSLDKKFVHVIRNPFDTITTTFRKTNPLRGEDADGHLAREIDNYFARCSTIRSIEQRFGASAVHHMYLEQLIADPVGQLRDLCSFLNVEAPEEYLRDCAAIVTKDPHRTRESLEWSNRHVDMVKQGMQECHWLANYEFGSELAA
jgi:hypothetical protein